MPRELICGDCDWYEQSGDTPRGECLVNPPELGAGGIAIWPMVTEKHRACRACNAPSLSTGTFARAKKGPGRPSDAVSSLPEPSSEGALAEGQGDGGKE